MSQRVGLRIDVDTLRGTRQGVQPLLQAFAEHHLKASFFFTVGPDNMGRHLYRLLRPTFLIKMLRTRAASLYGWDILLRGTLWPGPRIGAHCENILRATAEAGHEMGLHAWDHHAWQAHLDDWSPAQVHAALARGYREIERIVGQPPTCSATPSWKTNPTVLAAKATFPFTYNSDCRGTSIFKPADSQVQVPVTLPTYDEVIGRNGITDETYNAYLLDLIQPGKLQVLTIHAEAEGLAKHALFRQFLDQAKARDITFVPLGELLPATPPPGAIEAQVQPGREGWIAFQAPVTP